MHQLLRKMALDESDVLEKHAQLMTFRKMNRIKLLLRFFEKSSQNYLFLRVGHQALMTQGQVTKRKRRQTKEHE